MHSSWLKYCAIAISLGLWGCNQLGSLEDSLAPDPRLSQQPVVFGEDQKYPNLPEDFPAAIPLYPSATLIRASSGSTLWAIADDVNRLESFYRQTLQNDKWQILTDEPSETDSFSEIVAKKDDIELTISLPTTTVPSTETTETAVVGTTYILSYRVLETQPTLTSPDNPPPDDNPEPKATPEPKTTPEAKDTQQNASLPEQVADLVQLGVFTKQDFKAQESISRRQFARWLFTTHNLIYQDRPQQQIRRANANSQPVFTDVPQGDPDFAIIQGLAEAGLIASQLTDDTSSLTFRPDAPLTRETLIAWKVPLDRRQALPTTSLEAIAETWGFQDAAEIDSRALQALYVDFQNGDRSNVRRTFGYTTLFQPKKTVTQKEAAIALWYFGYQSEGLSVAEALKNK